MADVKLVAKEAFQFRGLIHKQDKELTVSVKDLKAEMAKGMHPKTKHPMSGLLNHCIPADEKAEALFEEFFGEEVETAKEKKEKEETKDAETRKSVMAELDTLSIPYRKNWGLVKLQEALIIGKKSQGE